jgi:TolA-binding protein
MKREAPELEPELESLLRFRTVARQLPDDVRARVLDRSRALVSASTSGRRAISRAIPFAEPRPPATSSSHGGGLRRLAIAAALAILAGAAGAVAALRTRAADAPPAAFPEGSVSFPAHVREESEPDPETEPATGTAAATTASHHAMTRHHPVAKVRGADPLAQVELLQHAHLAYARRDFRGALALVAEHARRFPNGPLAEECEALRVESLLAAGHVVEARRAGAAFAKRFPRSVLLPGIEETSHEDLAP